MEGGAVGMNGQAMTPFEKRQEEKKLSEARRKRRVRRRIVLSAVIALLGILVVTAAVLVLKTVDWDVVFGRKDPRISMLNESSEPYGPDPDIYFDPWESVTEYVQVTGSDIYRGECILVNARYPFRFEDAEEPVRVVDFRCKSYSAKNNRVYLTMNTIEAFNVMMDAYYDETDRADIMVSEGYRSLEDQEEIYASYEKSRGKDYAEKYVAKPGNSEHHSGLAMDLSVYTGVISTLKNEGKHTWLYENAAEYGFINRYQKGKEDITGFAAESWHFRYVSIPHSILIARQEYTLEEYLEYIRIYTYKGKRVNVESELTGDTYQIYFVYAEKETDADGNDVLDDNGFPVFKEVQNIPVPKGSEYKILGNNIDGYLVTIINPEPEE